MSFGFERAELRLCEFTAASVTEFVELFDTLEVGLLDELSGLCFLDLEFEVLEVDLECSAVFVFELFEREFGEVDFEFRFRERGEVLGFLIFVFDLGLNLF